MLARGVVHLLGPIPVPGEVLVVEHRHRAPAGAEHAHDLLEELVARIFVCPSRSWDNCRARRSAARRPRPACSAQRQRLGNGGIELHDGEARRAVAAEIALPDLIAVQGHQVHGRLVPRAVPAVAFQEAVHEVLRMRVLEHRAGYERNLHPRRRRQPFRRK